MNTLLVFRLKKNWKIPNGRSEVLYGRKTENIMTKKKEKRTNNDTYHYTES